MHHFHSSLTAAESEAFLELLSEDRISWYEKPGEPLKQTVQRYMWDVRLAEAMMPSLHILEVTLRNRIDVLFAQRYGANWLLERHEDLKLDDDILNAVEKKFKNHKDRKSRTSRKWRGKDRQLTNSDMVSRVSLGFWVSLFKKKYSDPIWHKKGNLAFVFPHMPHDQRTPKGVNNALFAIKELRNRIAHHESIWDYEIQINYIHAACRRLIAGISPLALAELDRIDRFAEVWEERKLWV